MQENRELDVIWPSVDSPNSVWSSYERSVSGELSITSRRVLGEDCEFIVERGIFGAGPGFASWSSRVRKGLVMGAVQSGKTASMLGVMAKAFDSGVDCAVLLSGTRVALWRQTYERTLGQLASAAGVRVVPASPPADGVSDLANAYRLSSAWIRLRIQRREPFVWVAMKHPAHIEAVAEMVRSNLVDAAARLDRPVHLVVLDDEADDGSVLDQNAEIAQDPIFGDFKRIPRSIQSIWKSPTSEDSTYSARLHVTYVAYTATPQANFLQADHNPLAATDFVASLRTPFDKGDPAERTSTYVDPVGLTSFYTGGETFYHRLRDTGVVETIDADTDGVLASAVRRFLVSAAVRHLRADEGVPSPAQSAAAGYFDTAAEAKQASSPASSMLYHPSARKEHHFEAARRVRAFLRGAPALDDADDSTWNLAGVIDADPVAWEQTLDEVLETSGSVRCAFSQPDHIRGEIDWPLVRKTILFELEPALRVKVVNSDDSADDRPEFEPQYEDDRWRVGDDRLTIFVSGNVMARGLTLEGLLCTIFLRASETPLADTQMQMQRWFGYRGRTLELTKIYLPADQLALFRRYHDADEALRAEILDVMQRDGKPPRPSVLQGASFKATGKVTPLRTVPLCPGASPLLPFFNDMPDDPNCDLVAKLFTHHYSKVEGSRQTRGLLVDRSFSLTETADLLDRVEFNELTEFRFREIERLWRAAAATVFSGEPVVELYKARSHVGALDSDALLTTPHTIAAYLRLWDACLYRSAPGLVPTDRPELEWRLEDLAARRREQPRFRVGLRFGDGSPITQGPLAGLGARAMRRARTRDADGRLIGRIDPVWGSQPSRFESATYVGDQYFDYYGANSTQPATVRAGETRWRRRGQPGLILFHPIDRKDGSVGMAVGCGIPLGGPDRLAAIVDLTSVG